MGYDLLEGRYGWLNRPTSTGQGRGTGLPPRGKRPRPRGPHRRGRSDHRDRVAFPRVRRPGNRRRPRTGTRGDGLSSGEGFSAPRLPRRLAPTDRRPAGLRIDDVPPTNRRWSPGRRSSSRPSPTPKRHQRRKSSNVNWSCAGRRWPAKAEPSPLGSTASPPRSPPSTRETTDSSSSSEPASRSGTSGSPGRSSRTSCSIHAYSGCRSVLINADEGGRPEALYRQLGFSDEVHWRRPWTRP